MRIIDGDKKKEAVQEKTEAVPGINIPEGSWFLSGGTLYHVKMRSEDELFPIIGFSEMQDCFTGYQEGGFFQNVEYVDVEITYRRKKQ